MAKSKAVRSRQRSALKQLSDLGLTPRSLDEAGADVPGWQRDISLSRKRIKDADLKGFLFNLSYMLQANLALLPSIEMVTQRVQNRQLLGILRAVITDLKNGHPLSQALRRADPTFDPQVHRPANWRAIQHACPGCRAIRAHT